MRGAAMWVTFWILSSEHHDRAHTLAVMDTLNPFSVKVQLPDPHPRPL